MGLERVPAVGGAGVAEVVDQFFDGPVWAGVVQAVSGLAVAPDAVAQSGEGVCLEQRLREESGEETGQGIPAAALSEGGVTGAVNKDGAGVVADGGLVAFEDHPGLAATFGERHDGCGPVLLDLGRGGVEEAGSFAGVGCHDAQSAIRSGFWGEPIKAGGVGDDGGWTIMPESDEPLLQVERERIAGETGAEEEGGGGFGQGKGALPGLDHHGLELGGDRGIDLLGHEQGDEAGVSALGGAGGEHGGAVVTEAAGHDDEVAEGPFVAVDGPGRGVMLEIIGHSPEQVSGVRTRDEADVGSDLESADVGAGGGGKQADFGGSEGNGDAGSDGVALRFSGIGVEPGGDVDGEDGDARVVDGPDEAAPVGIQWSVEADPEDAVEDQGLRQGAGRCELAKSGGGVVSVDQGHLAVGEVLGDLPGVVAVMALAGDDEDGVTRAGQGTDVAGEDMADAADDLEGGAFSGPGECFPLAHLRAADHGDWHGLRMPAAARHHKRIAVGLRESGWWDAPLRACT
jgi:hypothetical protein